jgi:hypothetical protein
VAVVALFLLWQLSDMHGEISKLRGELAQSKAVAQPNSQPATQIVEVPRTPQTVPSTTFSPSELGDFEKRLDELENTVGELADAWNRFAAEEQEKRRRASMRGWGPEQATGPPNTLTAGDQSTAWASQAPDAGMEWLEASYDRPVDIAEVRVLENHCPGAVMRVSAILDGGAEVTLWEGEEPKSPAPAAQSFPARTTVVASKVRVHLDTAKVPGWNEIDAVELVGRDGSRQWASSATASSTYAQGSGRMALDGLELRSLVR